MDHTSIPHHYYSDYSLSSKFCIAAAGADATWKETSDMFSNNNVVQILMNYDINSPVSVASFPDQQFGISDSNMVLPQMSEIDNMGFSDFAVCDYQHQVFEPGEEYCSGLVPANYPMPAENWAIIQGQPVRKVEETEMKVGRYSAEERKDRILRYLKKRNQRNFNKTIKYACRKTLADKRVRIRGRFAKNNESSEEEMMMMNKNRDTAYKEKNPFSEDFFCQMKYDEDCWFQADMANLVHLPYLAS